MAVKWLALRGPFTTGSWQALNGRQMATLKRAICDKKWLAMLTFLSFVALTETTNGPFMSCLLGLVILYLKSQVFLDLRTSINIWSPVSCMDGTWMIFLIYFTIILYQFLLYIIILQDKVMVSSFQHSRPTLGKHAWLIEVITFGTRYWN